MEAGVRAGRAMISLPQYRKLMKTYQQNANLSQSAEHAGVDRKTARKYVRGDAPPPGSEAGRPRSWKTHHDDGLHPRGGERGPLRGAQPAGWTAPLRFQRVVAVFSSVQFPGAGRNSGNPARRPNRLRMSKPRSEEPGYPSRAVLTGPARWGLDLVRSVARGVARACIRLILRAGFQDAGMYPVVCKRHVRGQMNVEHDPNEPQAANRLRSGRGGDPGKTKSHIFLKKRKNPGGSFSICHFTVPDNIGQRAVSAEENN